jgi:hypothetical protein
MFGSLTGWKKYIVVGLAFLALVAVIVVGVRGCKQDENDMYNETINTGAQIERGNAATEVLNRVEQGEDAVRNPTSNELNVVCDKYDRNCQGNL